MKPIDLLRASLHRRRSRYRSQLEDMAPAVRAHWLKHAPLEFPGIPVSELFFIRAAEGLMNFFEIAQKAHTSYALPSLAADSVWHAWLRWDEDDLARFCRRHFQAPVVHLPHEALDALALPRTLVACRHSDGIPAHAARLPRLFELDSRLRMPLGHAYRQRGFNIDYARLNAEGRYRYDGATHPALSLRALLAAGFIRRATAPTCCACRRCTRKANPCRSRSRWRCCTGRTGRCRRSSPWCATRPNAGTRSAS